MSTRHFRRRSTNADESGGGRTGARLEGLTLPCVRFVETQQFYTELLGLQVRSRAPNHVVLNAGGARLLLLDAGRVRGFSRGEGQTFYVELAMVDLERTRVRLERAGVRVVEPRAGGSKQLITAEDPEGNLLNLVQVKRRRGGGLGSAGR